jgi:hypothetical protein
MDRKGTFTVTDPQGVVYLERHYRVAPYAVILKAGEDFVVNGVKMETGQIVKISEQGALVEENPLFSNWNNNEYSQSNGVREGTEPPQWLLNYFNLFPSCKIDPTVQMDIKDYFTTRVHCEDEVIEYAFEDPHVLVI